jgi:hypothetical protein
MDDDKDKDKDDCKDGDEDYDKGDDQYDNDTMAAGYVWRQAGDIEAVRQC